jgi:hypothetical protein
VGRMDLPGVEWNSQDSLPMEVLLRAVVERMIFTYKILSTYTNRCRAHSKYPSRD